MSSPRTDLPVFEPSDTPYQAALPQTNNDQDPPAQLTGHKLRSQREGYSPGGASEQQTPDSESPIAKGEDIVSRLASATQDADNVAFTASKDLEAMSIVRMEHTESANAEKEVEQGEEEGRGDGGNNTEGKEIVAGGKEGQEEGDRKERIKAEEGKEEATEERATEGDSSPSTVDSDELNELDNLLCNPDKTEDLVAEHQQRGAKYARVTELYVEGLEARVGMLEKHVRKLLDSNKPLENIK